MIDIAVNDVPERNRFEAEVEGRTAFLDYTVQNDRLHLNHTSVPEALEGRGIGSRLARAALDSARERGLGVIPNCRFVASYIRRHPGYLDLVPFDYDRRDELERGSGD